MNKCQLCEDEGKNVFRCDKHYRCDDCGTKDGLCFHTEGLLCGECHKKRVAKRVTEFSGDTIRVWEITCPHCGYEVGDSWEFSCDWGDHECEDCGNEFKYERHTEVTY